MKKKLLFLGIIIPCFFRAQHEPDSTHHPHKGEVSIITNFEPNQNAFKDPFTWGYRKFEHTMIRFGHSFGEQAGTEVSMGYPILGKRKCWFSPNFGILKRTNTNTVSILTGNFLAFNTEKIAGASIIQYSFGTHELFTLNEIFYHIKLRNELTLSPGITFEGLLYKKSYENPENGEIIEEHYKLFGGPLTRLYIDGFFVELGALFTNGPVRFTGGVGHEF